MPKPLIHAEADVRRWGGVVEDYLPIHDLMDSSKGAIATQVHRALTHTSWFLSTILERVFGDYIVNTDGKKVSVRDIGENHVLMDYRGKFIPTAQDFLQEMELKLWMMNGEDVPPSFQKIENKKVTKVVKID